jgi:hypothetical protein
MMLMSIGLYNEPAGTWLPRLCFERPQPYELCSPYAVSTVKIAGHG